MGYSQSTQRYANNRWSKVRLLHNVAGAPNVDVFVDGKKVGGSVSYKDYTDYLKLNSGSHRLVVKAAGAKRSDKPLVCKTVTLKSCKMYTVIVAGDVKALCDLAVLALIDQTNDKCDTNARDPEQSYVRFVHAAAAAPAVDVYSRMAVAEAGTEGTDDKIFSDYSYKDYSKFRPVSPGEVTLLVSLANSLETVVLGPLTLNLEKGKSYSIIATGVPGSETDPLDAVLIVDRDLYICL